MARNVILYHQPGLGDCRNADEFLRQKGISYVSKDVRADLAALDDLVNKWESRATATPVIDGEVIIGFNQNRQRIAESLSEK